MTIDDDVTLLESAEPSPVDGAAPAADASPSVESVPAVEEVAPEGAANDEPEDLSEPQKSNWRRLREARDDFETRFRESETQYTALREKLEPVEPVLDALVGLGNSLAPLEPNPSEIRDHIRQISPLADRYLAGAYLQEHGNWFVAHITDGAVDSVDALKALLASGARAPSSATAQPPPSSPGLAADPRLQAQLGYLDDDLRAAIEQKLSRVDEIEREFGRLRETEAERAARERDDRARQTASQAEAVKESYAIERVAQIDALLERAGVQPTAEGGVPNRLYNHVKELTVMALAKDPKANQAMTIGQEARAAGQTLEAARQARAFDQLAVQYFKEVADEILKPAQSAAVARQQQTIEQAKAQPAVVRMGAAVPPTGSAGRREYSRDPVERKQQLTQVISGLFQKKR